MSPTDRRLCLVVLPETGIAPSTSSALSADGDTTRRVVLDQVYEIVRTVVEEKSFDCVRAAFVPGEGFTRRSLAERLLLADCVVADRAVADPEVAFLLGVRHGASDRPTLSIKVSSPPAELEASLRKQIETLDGARMSIENPLVYATRRASAERLEHDQTDVFLARFDPVGACGRRIREALELNDASEAVARLGVIEREILANSEMQGELDSSLLAIYLGYRERKAYSEMVGLAARMPIELRRTAVVQNQQALALNRLAEQAEREGDRERAAGLRGRALAVLDLLPPEDVTSETWGIRGRIYKGHYESESSAGNQAAALAMLDRSIESYEAGLEADLRDYYPGVNAVTLRFLRGRPEDLAALDSLVPVVRMAVDNAPTAESGDELYWQSATRMELACAARDWTAARSHLALMLGVDPADWMLETTSRNLGIQLLALKDEPESVASLLELIRELSGGD